MTDEMKQNDDPAREGCICEYPESCGGMGFLECEGCGGEFCVCGACDGYGCEDCPGCEECDDEEGGVE